MKNVLKVLFVLLLGFAFLAASVAPVAAQDGTPPTGPITAVTDESPPVVMDWIQTILILVTIVGVNSVVGSSGVEVVKDLTRKLFAGTRAKVLQIQGLGTVIALLLASYLLISGYDQTFVSQIFSEIDAFKDIDPAFLKVLDTVLLWIAQVGVHKWGLPDITYKARDAV